MNQTTENNNPDYQSPYKDIFEAAERGVVDDVRYFIDELGIDVNVGVEEFQFFNWKPPRMKGPSKTYYRIHFENFTPLHIAVASNPNVDVIKYLISQGANVNARNKYSYSNRYFEDRSDGWTPLHMAAINNSDAEVFEYLISHGADIKTRNTYGSTLLHVAAHYNNSIEVIEYLISQGLDVNEYNSNSMTPLHYAAFYNPDIEVLKYLISQSAEKVLNRWNETLLHMAAFGNPNVEVIKYLISKGFDVNAESKYGETPLDLAEKNPNYEIWIYIKNYLDSQCFEDKEDKIKFDYIGEFHEGLARVRKGSKWGYIDKSENIIIPLEYKIAYNFSNGVALVSKTIVEHGYNYSHGYINRKGKVLTPFIYETFESVVVKDE